MENNKNTISIIDYKKHRRRIFLLFLFVAVALGTGYALLQALLNISGTTKIQDSTWDIYWQNIQVAQGSVTGEQVVTAPTLSENNTKVTFSVRLNKPGDYYEFTVDAINNGNIDAMVETISKQAKINDNVVDLPSYVEYKVTYSDGKPILEDHLLPKKTGNTPTTQTYKVRVYYNEQTVTEEEMNAVESDISYTLIFNVTYRQATTSAIQKPTTLQNDSWETITANVRKDKSCYNIGETKTIQMDIDGDNTNETYTLRVANNTTPSECNQEDFSQSACGFVLEFKDIITTHRMKSQSSPRTWIDSDMRAFLNTEVFASGTEDEQDYATTGIFNKLPSELKNNIISTKIQSESTSLDKLYLLSHREIFSTSSSSADTFYSTTRQLDYYKINPENSKRIKKLDFINRAWWLRSISNPIIGFKRFGVVDESGTYYVNDDYETTRKGVSPAFRIAA